MVLPMSVAGDPNPDTGSKKFGKDRVVARTTK